MPTKINSPNGVMEIEKPPFRRVSLYGDIRHLKIHVYRKPQTAGDHVTTPRRYVCGKFFTFSTARGGVSRKSFTSEIFGLNFALSHV